MKNYNPEEDFGAVYCQMSFKVSPEIKKAVKRYGLNISSICRTALSNKLKEVSNDANI